MNDLYGHSRLANRFLAGQSLIISTILFSRSSRFCLTHEIKTERENQVIIFIGESNIFLLDFQPLERASPS